MSLTDTETLLRTIRGNVKLALAKAIASAADSAENEEDCETVRDLAQAFIFLPTMGDIPDFVHSHGGVDVTPTPTPAPTPSPTPTPTPTPAPVHSHGTPAAAAGQVTTGSHAHADGIADLPAGIETQLDALVEKAGIDPMAQDTGMKTVTSTAASGAGAAMPTPAPITPAQMALEQALEDARVAVMDALAKASKHAIEKSECIVLLAEAWSLLPRPNVTLPPLGHSHGAAGPAPGHSHGTPAPTPTPSPAPTPSPTPVPPVHSHG